AYVLRGREAADTTTTSARPGSIATLRRYPTSSPWRGLDHVSPPSRLSKYPSPAETRNHSGVSIWTASSWVSKGPPGTRSRHVRPPSWLEISAPASIATHKRPGSRGWQAIQRTWCVSGLGGKDQSADEGSFS